MMTKDIVSHSSGIDVSFTMEANIHGRTPVEIVPSTKSIENKRNKGGAENQCIHRDKDTVHFKRISSRVYIDIYIYIYIYVCVCVCVWCVCVAFIDYQGWLKVFVAPSILQSKLTANIYNVFLKLTLNLPPH
jgi:hypothetical protein